MRNIFIIGLIIVAMVYIFSILYGKYENIINEENMQKTLTFEHSFQKHLNSV